MPPAKRLPHTLAPALPCHCRSPPRLPQAPARPPPAPSPPLAGQTRPAQPLFPCCIAPGRPNPTKKPPTGGQLQPYNISATLSFRRVSQKEVRLVWAREAGGEFV